jgi:two-component system nitrogen regulation response regulator NtrX
VVERLLLLCDDEVDPATLRLVLPQSAGVTTAGTASAQQGTLAQRVEFFEKQVLLDELKRHDYQMAATARALGLERSHLYKKCQHLGIDLESARRRE